MTDSTGADMNHDDLRMLLSEFPDGEWTTRPSAAPGTFDVVCIRAGKEAIVAQSLDMRAATLLIQSKRSILKMAKDLEEEVAYSANLEHELSELRSSHSELSSKVASLEEELFIDSRTAPRPVIAPTPAAAIHVWPSPQKYLM